MEDARLFRHLLLLLQWAHQISHTGLNVVYSLHTTLQLVIQILLFITNLTHRFKRCVFFIHNFAVSYSNIAIYHKSHTGISVVYSLHTTLQLVIQILLFITNLTHRFKRCVFFIHNFAVSYSNIAIYRKSHTGISVVYSLHTTLQLVIQILLFITNLTHRFKSYIFFTHNFAVSYSNIAIYRKPLTQV